MKKAIDHLSDCSIHDDQACDCNGLDLTLYSAEDFIPTFVTATRRFGFFVGEVGRECFIEPEILPPLTLAAIASAAHLPSMEDAVAILSESDGVDFNQARISIISELEALSRTQGLTSNS